MKKPTPNPTTLGELNPGDTCVLPLAAPFADRVVRVRVTGILDCGVLWRHVDREDCRHGDGEPHVSPSGCTVTDVLRRAPSAESKAPDTDPLIGGAR